MEPRQPTIQPASFLSRFLAVIIDGILCLFIPIPVASMIAAATTELVFYPLLFGIVLAYFALGSHYGGTLGERATSLRVVDAGTGTLPTIRQAVVRSVSRTVLIVTGFTVLMLGFADAPDGGYSDTAIWILGMLTALFGLSVLTRVWMVFDRQRRTLTDRLVGVAVVRPPEREPRVGPTPHSTQGA